MHVANILNNIVENHQIFAYVVIFLGLIFEGEIILISAGILAHLGALDFGITLFFVLFGGLVKTLLFYRLGEFIHKKWNHTKLMKYIEERVFNFMPHFDKKPFWSIFISKFIMGVNYLVIIFSGYKKIDYKTYLKAEFFSTIIWAPLLLTLGYFFSYTALNISKEISRFFLIIIILIIGFVLFDKLLAFVYKMFEKFNDK
ncbi:MAG: VTT domain-containing protein, partial [Patescibacteria group bacterium]